MKMRMLGIILLFAASSVLIIGCPGKNSPSTPAAPTPTDTSCANAQGTPCTSTFTATPSNTATTTPTGTPTSTATVTDTRTPTSTLTNTATSTPTGTPSNTATITPTATITDTPTDTGTSTLTGTPTDTGVPTSTNTPTNTGIQTSTGTPTRTPTSTPTFCPTQSQAPSMTPTGPYSLSGSVTYSPGVTGGNSIKIGLIQPGANADPIGVTSASSPANYTFTGLGSGNTYSLVYYYGTEPYFRQPNIGDPIGCYGTSTCDLGSGTQFTMTGNVSGLKSSFNTTNQIQGIQGTVTYTGSKGVVDGCHGILLQLWPSGTNLTGGSGSVTCSGCNSIGGGSYVQTNGSVYANLMDSSNPCGAAVTTYNVFVYYMAPSVPCTGNCNTIQPGDPYYWATGVSLGSTANYNISFGDSNIY